MKSNGKGNENRRDYIGCTHHHLYYFTMNPNDIFAPKFPTQVYGHLIQSHLPPQTQWQQPCSRQV